MQSRIACAKHMRARSLSPLIITRPFQEALTSLQLILTWIRDNKQPINEGLNEEMELVSAAELGGWQRLITPLPQLYA